MEVKVDQDDVTRICKQFVDHDVDTKIVAEQFEISRRRVRQLAKEYREDGEIPELETPILSVTSVDRLLRLTRGSNVSRPDSVDPGFDGL